MTKDRFKSVGLMVLALFLGISLAVILYFYQVLYKADYFLPGVKVASIAVQGYSREESAGLIENWLKNIYDTPVRFNHGDYTYESKLRKLCLAVDTEELIDEIWEKEKQRDLKSKILNMDGSKQVKYPLKIEYDPQKKEKLFDEWIKVLNIEAVNAKLDIDREKGLIVIPGQEGEKVDIAGTFAGLPQEWEDFDSIEADIVTKIEKPLIDEKALESMGEISSFSTWYNTGDVNRSHNLVLACEAINGSAIAPENIFSFNQAVGERIVAAGYRDALVIVNGKFEPGLGGGVCQVSSTLYNACLLAGMEILERHNHGLAVAYVPLGRDATVVYGLQDFKFKNNSSHPVYLRALAQAGKLEINLYGDLEFKEHIELSHVVDQVIAFQETREVDPDMPTGEEKIDHEGFPGYVVRSFRTFFDESGEIVKQEQLARDYYKPLNKLVYIAPLETEQTEGAAENEAGTETEENTGQETVPEDLPAEPTGPSTSAPTEVEQKDPPAGELVETLPEVPQENENTGNNGEAQGNNDGQ